VDFDDFPGKPINWEELGDASYAIWAPSDEDPLFTKSQVTGRWTDIYETVQEIESYIAANILRNLGLSEDFVNRIELPDELNTIAVLAAGGIHIIISFSQDKGIRFHFPNTASLDYRLNFLDRYIEVCKSLKKEIEVNNWSKDADQDSIGWWNSTLKIIAITERNGAVDEVGKII